MSSTPPTRIGTRVVLTVQSFAWTPAGLDRQKALLGSSTARAQPGQPGRRRHPRPRRRRRQPRLRAHRLRLCRGIHVARPHDPGRARQASAGYQLTFDTTGYIGNYPIEDAHRVRAAPTRSSSWATTTGPPLVAGRLDRAADRRPGYDIRDTVAGLHRARPGLEAHPRRALLRPGLVDRDATSFNAHEHLPAPSTAPRRRSSTRPRVDYLADHGRRYDAGREASRGPPTGARTARRPTAASPSGGSSTSTTPPALQAKYDLVNRYGLRGAGIWALGYDGTPDRAVAGDRRPVHRRT